MLFVLLIVISGVIAHSMMSMLQRQQLIDQLDLRLKSIAMALRPQVSEYISARLEDEILSRAMTALDITNPICPKNITANAGV